MIDVQSTIQKFGYDPSTLKPKSGKRVVYHCLNCQAECITDMATYNRSSKNCKSCARKNVHKDLTSGYHTQQFKKLRSQIAVKSNTKRKVTSERFQKYLPFLEDIRDGKLINKRKMFCWAKKVGLTKVFGTTNGKIALALMLGGKKIVEPAKIKLEKIL